MKRKLVIGQNGTGKTTTIKNSLSSLSGKIVVLDFKGEYEEEIEQELYLDNVNPLLSPIGLNEAKALNAGYLTDGSRLLYTQCELLLKERKSSDPSFLNLNIADMKQVGLIEEAVERLSYSWSDRVHNKYSQVLSTKIPLKKKPDQISVEQAVDVLLSHDQIRLRSKGMNSDHQRSVTFAVLSCLSRKTDEPIWIVADDLSKLMNQGNMKLFLESINTNNLNFLFSFSKSSNVPKVLIPTFDEVYLHRFENKPEIKELISLGIIPFIPTNLDKFKNGQYEFISKIPTLN